MVAGGILGRFGTVLGVAVAAGIRASFLGATGLMAGAAVTTFGAAQEASKRFLHRSGPDKPPAGLACVANLFVIAKFRRA